MGIGVDFLSLSQMTPHSLFSALIFPGTHMALVKSSALYMELECHLEAAKWFIYGGCISCKDETQYL